MNATDGIDVVMVSYRSPDDAQAFAVSYVETRPACSSLFVGNVDPTVTDLAAMELALVDVPGDTCLITYSDNIGYGRACNDLAAMGDREIIAFFNADTRLSPGLLQEIHGVMLANPGWGVVGPRQVDDQGHITHAGIFGDEAHPRHRGWHELDQGQYNDINDDAVSVSGAAYFIRRDVWDELSTCPIYLDHAPDAQGAFLPTPHYFDETWCSYHARDHGWKVVYYGPAGMIHRWHQASPVGGIAETTHYPISEAMFRAACEAHRIPHN